MNSTICALATAPAPAGIAVIRISGPDCATIITAVFQSALSPAARPREMIFGKITDTDGSAIDHGLCVFFKSPASFTGEDLAELHIHGSPLIAGKVIRRLLSLGAESAKPGEFTQRAFLNGKIDLLQAEAIGDLISAGSEQALKIATEQIEGRFSHYLEQIAEPLRDTLAEIEAGVDFPEEDIEPDDLQALTEILSTLKSKIKDSIQTYDYGHSSREGFRVLITGKPNAGKSSLLNALLERPRAIVTDISGTTRDLIEESLNYEGWQFVFCDSAGLTSTDNEVEKIGVELAIQKIAWADMLWLVLDSASANKDLKSILPLLEKYNKKIWLIVNKCDLCKPSELNSDLPSFRISARDADGTKELLQALIQYTANLKNSSSDCGFIVTNERQRQCLINADTYLQKSLDVIAKKMPAEILSIEIRAALSALDEIIGKTCNEDILGRIFSKFCIGK